MNKPMTHEEILLRWHKYGTSWVRVTAYNNGEYCLNGAVWKERSKFIREESCIIPPEGK